VTDLERDLGRRWFEEVWNKGRREAIAEMLTPGALIHDGGTDTAGAEGFYPFYDRLRGAFSRFMWRSRIPLQKATKSAYGGLVPGSILATHWAWRRLAPRST
jgi:hypothetical protein